jgi:hypothetical protein
MELRGCRCILSTLPPNPVPFWLLKECFVFSFCGGDRVNGPVSFDNVLQILIVCVKSNVVKNLGHVHITVALIKFCQDR